jgi:hypothetical protein
MWLVDIASIGPSLVPGGVRELHRPFASKSPFACGTKSLPLLLAGLLRLVSINHYPRLFTRTVRVFVSIDAEAPCLNWWIALAAQGITSASPRTVRKGFKTAVNNAIAVSSFDQDH